MNEECLILTTGGTIDKVYFDAKSSYAVGDSEIDELLMHGHVTLPYRIVELMRKDSLEMTDSDRSAIRSAVEQEPNRMVLVTHGTDTMTETAMALGGIPGRSIVLTGALLPARFRDNDAIFNIGFALAAVQTLPAGVYVAMNGRVFNPDRVRKDRQRNRFVDIEKA
ncbi:MAG: asparaginase domain-containing protein [Opitutales bacterium]|jgi:L-asparaginase